MNISAPFRALKSRLQSDPNDPRQRYIYVDGSPYGSRGLARFLMNPSIKSASVAGLFAVAGFVWLQSKADLRTTFVAGSVMMLANFGWNHFHGLRIQSRRLGELNNLVIDKTGRTVGDSRTTQKLCTYYERLKWDKMIITPILTAIFADLSSRVSSAAFSTTLLFAIIPMVTYNANEAAFAIRAKRKLVERQWTVQANPPKLLKVAANGMAGEMVPARINSSGIKRPLYPKV